jgi:serine protease
MEIRTPIRRWVARGSTAALVAVAAATAMQAAAVPAQAAAAAQTQTAAAASAGMSSANPYSPAYHHAYRHGVIPTIGQLKKMRRWAKSHHGSLAGTSRSASTVLATSSNNLSFGGGINGVGVTTGTEKVYLVFYGSQWGTQSTNSSGDITLSGDPSGEAPYLQQLFKGLGTGGETWSGVMTQYCQGVSTGAQTCPASNTYHVAYPTGGAIAGVWVDESTASPQQATGSQLAQEAINAAGHFGNTTASSNRDAQYVILSPTGTNPDGFNTSSGNFCAWHDYNADPSLPGGPVSSPYGDIAFTNMPYVTDAGTSCGEDFVNSNGLLDGVSIVEGHEYAETITDQFPAGGWTDSSGYETGDKCAWISPGTTGGAADLTLTTGTFAMQSTWANDDNSGSGGCEFSHPIVTNPSSGNTITVTNPGNQSGTAGTATSLQIQATDSSSSATLSYAASGLPAGLSINSSTGLISGTPTTAATYSVTVTVTDGTGASGSASFTWTIASSGGGGGCTAAQLLGNPGFETGSISPWTSTAGVLNNTSTGEPAQSGSWFAWLDGYGQPHTDTLAQTVTIPSNCTSATLSFWLYVQTDDPSGAVYDTFKVQVLNSSGTVLKTLATYSNENAGSGYVQHSFSLSSFIGQKITIKFTGTETLYGYYTSFLEDTNALNVS